MRGKYYIKVQKIYKQLNSIMSMKIFCFPAKGKGERKQAGGKGDEDEKDQTAVHRDARRF